MLQTQEIDYQVGAKIFRGFVAYTKTNHPKPCILIAPNWSGRNEDACNRAKQLAELGYVGFAVDMYGEAATGDNNEERSRLLNDVMSDRSQVTERMLAAFASACQLPYVNANKVAAIGYCFGGLCVLDLARAGANVKGVASFHGLLSPPEVVQCAQIKAKVLVLHGYNDPMAPPDNVFQFAKEMTQRKVNWEMDMYGHTKHSFTDPNAHDQRLGLEYNAQADKRSWQRVLDFFDECLN